MVFEKVGGFGFCFIAAFAQIVPPHNEIGETVEIVTIIGDAGVGRDDSLIVSIRKRSNSGSTEVGKTSSTVETPRFLVQRSVGGC
ncbi:hypothetical protein DCC62_08865 [candidate division KSB1 bacterium]|nr:MAG: hypothetical protein DCC62_08865 [candidate division KSB1 bacterium]